MNWPMPQDFNEAVQNPASSFSDADLKSSQAVVGPTGLPLPRSGNFADVYQMRAASGKDWALKCFTRPVTGLDQRYMKIGQALKKAGLSFTIGFEFLNEGMMVHGAWRPAVKMEWVDGLQLNQVVRVQVGSPKVLDALSSMWSKLCKKLREAGIAHADLQHGNVLLVAGSKPGSYVLKLIDYDGMYVPALANTPSGEAGHPNYQHPQRAAKQVYSPDLDRFPHLVIATALKGLSVLGPKLWEKYDTGDNLLFTEEDFKSPANSALMKELWQSNHPALQALVGHLAIACNKPIPQTPWLDQIAPEGVPAPLTIELAVAAATALGVSPPAGTVVKPVHAEEYGVDLIGPTQSVLTSAFGNLEGSVELPAPQRVRKPLDDDDDDYPRPRKKSSMLPLVIGGGVFAIVIAVVAAVALSGGDKKPDETAQKGEDKDKDKPKTPDKEKEKEKDKERPKPPDVSVPPKKDPPKVDPEEFSFDPANVPELTMRWRETVTQIPKYARFTKDGEYVIVRDGLERAVRVFSARTSAKLAGFTEGEATLVDFTPLPDGNVASWHVDQPFAIVWNPATGKGVGRIPVRPVNSPNGADRIFVGSPDGKYVAMGHMGRGPDNGKLTLSSTDPNKELVTLEVKQPKILFTETHLVVGDTDRVQFFKLPGGASDREVKMPQANPGSRVFALSGDGTLALHNTRGNHLHLAKGEKKIVSLPDRITSLACAISDDGRLLAAISPADPRTGEPSSFIEVADIQTKKLIGRYLLGTGAVDVSTMAFAPDNSGLVITRSGRRVEVVDMPRDVVAMLPKPKDPMPPEPKPKDPMPKPKDPDPKPKDPPPMPKPVERSPMPGEDAIARAETKLHGLLKDDYAKKGSPERKVLALKLLGLAEDTADDPALRYAMLMDAREIGIEIFETPIAMQALDGVFKHFTVDQDALRLATLDKINDVAGNTTTRRTVAELALAASDVAMAADNHAFALKYAQTAAAAAKRGTLPAAIVEEADAQIAKAQKAADAFKPVAEAIAKLKSDPKDADAAEVVGRHRCFMQGRWEEGLPLLAKSASEVKQAAAMDVAAPKAAPTDTKIADAWWAAAEAAIEPERSAMRYRARHWYALALPSLAADAKSQAENRLGFNAGGADHRTGLIAEFTAKVPAILMGKKARVDDTIDFNSGEFKADGAGVATDLAVKWTGAIAPQRAGRFRIAVAATDPVIVRIDGRIAIDTNGKGAKRDAMVTLPARPVPIVVEFKSINTEKHSVKLLWSVPGTDAEELIPPEALTHDKKLESVLPKP